MAVKTTWEKDGVHWELTEVVSFGQIINTIQSFYQDIRSDKARYQIINASNLDSFKVTERDMKCVAALDYGASQSIKELKVACISDDSENTKVFELYIQVSRELNSSWNFDIFTSLEEARKWIGE